MTDDQRILLEPFTITELRHCIIDSQGAVNSLAMINHLLQLVRKLPDEPSIRNCPLTCLYLHQLSFLCNGIESDSPRYSEHYSAIAERIDELALAEKE